MKNRAWDICAIRDEIGRKQSKICIIIFYLIFFTRKRYRNDTLENDTDNEKLMH
jgi:hypothetical protein